jgi:hypothetical protein
MAVTGSGPMGSNCKRGQGSSWTVVPAEKKRKKIMIVILLERMNDN